MLHRCRLRCRNTQRQFLRAALPVGATIWSTLVDNVPIKPCIDEEGQVSHWSHGPPPFILGGMPASSSWAPAHILGARLHR